MKAINAPGDPASPVNTPGLKKLYHENEVARALFDHFASRTNDSRATKLDRAVAVLAARDVRASVADVREVFRQLEQLGCGRYVIGRRGHPSRFIWTAGLVSVGQVASGEDVEIEEVRTPGDLEDGATAETLDHVFQLRPSLTVSFSLPANLTPTEAARLGDFIRTLPFEPGNQPSGQLA